MGAFAVLWLLSFPGCGDATPLTIDDDASADARDANDAERDTLPGDPLPPPTPQPDATSHDGALDGANADALPPCAPITTYPFGCDRLAQTGCHAGEACMASPDGVTPTVCDGNRWGTRCWPAGGGRQGDRCSNGAPCAVGFECSWLITTDGVCRQICDPAHGPTCPAGLSCDLVFPSYTVWECR